MYIDKFLDLEKKDDHITHIQNIIYDSWFTSYDYLVNTSL